MTEAFPTRKLARRRERKGTKATDKATVAAYNRAGIDAVEGIVDAIGAGTAAHWQEDEE